MGRAIRMKNGLTQKQTAFKKEIIKQIANGKQINGTQAVLKSYGVKDKNIAGGIAYENLRKPQIKDDIENALRKSGISQELFFDEIKNLAIAKPKEISADVKLRALIEMGKFMKVYPDSKNPHITFNLNTQINNLGFDEAKKRLTEMSSEGQIFIDEAGTDSSSP